MKMLVESSKEINKLRSIISDQQAKRINGMWVDGYTARKILMVYDRANTKNKMKMDDLSIGKLVDVADKIHKRYGVNEADESDRPLFAIARDIRQNWKNVNPHAKPYLDAMTSLADMDDKYMFDSARSIVARFLSNAQSWRGEDARRIKKELKKKLNESNVNESDDRDPYDTLQKRIAIDTIKNPNKSLMGGPAEKEAREILKKKFGYTDDEIDDLKREGVKREVVKRYIIKEFSDAEFEVTGKYYNGDKYRDVVTGVQELIDSVQELKKLDKQEGEEGVHDIVDTSTLEVNNLSKNENINEGGAKKLPDVIRQNFKSHSKTKIPTTYPDKLIHVGAGIVPQKTKDGNHIIAVAVHKNEKVVKFWYIVKVNENGDILKVIDKAYEIPVSLTRYVHEINERYTSAEITTIRNAMEEHGKMMGLSDKLEELGFETEFATDPLPNILVFNGSGSKLMIVNKKYVEGPDFTVGNLAVGIMEGNISEEFKVAEAGGFGNAITAAQLRKYIRRMNKS